MRACVAVSPLCSIRVSVICFSTVCSGLSEVIGSWKIIEIRSPRMSWSTDFGAPTSSRPRYRMLPWG